MRVLVACEYSARVRDAFLRKGHDAWSCDFRECEGDPARHIKGDVIDILSDGWDLMIAHPPCTNLSQAGVRWLYHPKDTALAPHNRRRHPDYPNRMEDVYKDAAFFNRLLNAPIPKKCVENSKMHGAAISLCGLPDQVVQPWHFGSPKTKGASLRLIGLPPLKLTHSLSDYGDQVIEAACHKEAPGVDRERNRSRTDLMIAAAFAENWG